MSTYKHFTFALTAMNRNEIYEENETQAMQAFDTASSIVGTWRFLCGVSIFCMLWIVWNGFEQQFAFDPYPFTILQLVMLLLLICICCVHTAAIVGIRRRLKVAYQQDFHEMQKLGHDLRQIAEHLSSQDTVLNELLERMVELQERSKGKRSVQDNISPNDEAITRYIKSQKTTLVK